MSLKASLFNGEVVHLNSLISSGDSELLFFFFFNILPCFPLKYSDISFFLQPMKVGAVAQFRSSSCVDRTVSFLLKPCCLSLKEPCLPLGLYVTKSSKALGALVLQLWSLAKVAGRAASLKKSVTVCRHRTSG